MIRLFILYPLWYFVPAIVTMVLMVTGARYFPKLYKGEGEILRDPWIILPCSLLWFWTVPMGVVGTVFWLAGKFFGLLIPNASDKSLPKSLYENTELGNDRKKDKGE